ncbi:hypothetical protein [sulfur-oxidizing endosymbiont of Gigantopelta aegis]
MYWERSFWLYYRTLEKGNSSGRWKKNNPLFR